MKRIVRLIPTIVIVWFAVGETSHAKEHAKPVPRKRASRSLALESKPLCPAVLRPAFESVDPALILSKHGLDPERIRFEANMTTEFDPQRPERFNWGIRVFYDGEEAGFISVGADPFGSPEVSVGVTEVRSRPKDDPRISFQGKGLGAILYLITGKIAHEKWGLTFTKSGQFSTDAVNLWDRLASLGYVNPETHEFIPKTLTNGSLEKLQTYFDAHLVSRPEWTNFYPGFVDELEKIDPERAKPYR